MSRRRKTRSPESVAAAPRLESKAAAHFQRSWKRAGALGLVCLLLLAGAGGAYVWYTHSGPEPPAVEIVDGDPAAIAAIQEARERVRRSSRSASAWGNLGMVLLAQAIIDKAQFCFEQAERLDPLEPRWPYAQGLILVSQNMPAAAAKLELALQLSPKRPEAWQLKLAEILLTLGRNSEAAGMYRLLLQQPGSHPLAHLGLARIANEDGQLESCLSHLKECADDPHSRKAAHALTALVYKQRGDAKTANQQLLLAEQAPEDRVWPDPFVQELSQFEVSKVGRLMNAQRLIGAMRLDEAQLILEQLARDYPDWHIAWEELGKLFIQKGQYAPAERLLRRALQIEPDSVEALFSLATVLFYQRKYDDAVGYYRRVTELKPDHALAYLDLGKCLKVLGKRADAMEAASTALRMKPFLAEAHRLLGELFAQAGRRAEALEHLREALDLAPGEPKAKKLLEQLETGDSDRKESKQEPRNGGA
jgi:tetratricopeptide (TPR) repeat protein